MVRTRIWPPSRGLNHTLRPLEPPRSVPWTGIPFDFERLLNGERILVADAGQVARPAQLQDLGAAGQTGDVAAWVAGACGLHPGDQRRQRACGRYFAFGAPVGSAPGSTTWAMPATCDRDRTGRSRRTSRARRRPASRSAGSSPLITRASPRPTMVGVRRGSRDGGGQVRHSHRSYSPLALLPSRSSSAVKRVGGRDHQQAQVAPVRRCRLEPTPARAGS